MAFVGTPGSDRGTAPGAGGVRLPFLVSRIVAEYLVPAFQGQGSKAEAGLHCLLSATSVSHPHKFKIMDGYPGDKAFH